MLGASTLYNVSDQDMRDVKPSGPFSSTFELAIVVCSPNRKPKVESSKLLEQAGFVLK
jgi:hypothetical protein